MRLDLYTGDDPRWQQTLDRVLTAIPDVQRVQLFPYHFLAVALQRIGGRIITLSDGNRLVAAGFLFPGTLHQLTQPDLSLFTMRYHRLSLDFAQSAAEVADTLGRKYALTVTGYEPDEEHQYTPTSRSIGAVEYGRASSAEAQRIRELQESVWRSPPESLYPVDIHSQDFPLATSIVARVDGEVAGFLFGAYKYGGPPLPADWQDRHNGALRIESQLLSVHPAQRGKRIGFHLKQLQAEEARAQGIGIINWTVDPLQFGNAVLNLGLLRGVCFDFYPDLYPFRNELNRVPASRCAITWLVNSAWARRAATDQARSYIHDISQRSDILRANHAVAILALDIDSQSIAFEIPREWTQLQSESLDEALEWRTTTDRLLAHYVGLAADQYTLTGVGVDGERCYLLGERSSPDLWKTLGATVFSPLTF